jgi:hypothetical protein
MSLLTTLAIALGACVLLFISIWIVAGAVGAARDRVGHRRRRREHRYRPKIDMFQNRREGGTGADESAPEIPQIPMP